MKHDDYFPKYGQFFASGFLIECGEMGIIFPSHNHFSHTPEFLIVFATLRGYPGSLTARLSFSLHPHPWNHPAPICRTGFFKNVWTGGGFARQPDQERRLFSLDPEIDPKSGCHPPRGWEAPPRVGGGTPRLTKIPGAELPRASQVGCFRGPDSLTCQSQGTASERTLTQEGKAVRCPGPRV